jgi:hypothetical protein
LNNWRHGLYIFFGWLFFEDFARKFPGNNMAIYFAKDVLVILVYISFGISRRLSRSRLNSAPYLLLRQTDLVCRNPYLSSRPPRLCEPINLRPANISRERTDESHFHVSVKPGAAQDCLLNPESVSIAVARNPQDSPTIAQRFVRYIQA